jgi:hypothetical protein
MSVSPLPSPLVSFLAACALASGLAACGSEDRTGLIPSDDAQRLGERLGDVKSHVEDGDCDPVPEELTRLRSSVAALPSSVDSRLRKRLDEGVEHLAQVAPEQCQEVALGATEAPPEETETVTTEPETTTTALPTTTTPVEPPTTETTAPTVTTPPTSTTVVPPETGGTPSEPGATGTGEGG